MILFQVICHNSSQFQNMEVSCQLVTGPVYLAGETITCQISVVNNAATTQVSVHWGSALDCSSLGFLKSRFQVLAWASASLHCFCTVSDSKVVVAVLYVSDWYVPHACRGRFPLHETLFSVDCYCMQVAILDREVTRKSSTSNPPNSTSFQVNGLSAQIWLNW